MPFTVSHIAAVLPLRSVRGTARSVFANLPALGIGAMAPDFSYILGLVGFYFEAHDVAGLFAVAWPMALLAYVLYEHWIEKPWVRLLPWLDRTGYPRTLVSALVGTLLGAATHLFWDAFTHGDGFFVENIPWLNTPVFDALHRNFAVYSLLQHGSSIVGGSLVLYAIRRAIGRSPEKVFTRSWRELLAVTAVAAAIGIAVTVVPVVRYAHVGGSFLSFLVNVAFRLLGAAAITLVSYATLKQITGKDL